MKKLINTPILLGLVFTFSLPRESFSQAGEITVFTTNMQSKPPNKFYEEEYRNVGVYKVRGSSYLMKGNNVSDIFTSLGFGTNIPLAYDLHTQELGVVQPDKKSIIYLSLAEVDSFYLKVDNDNKFEKPVMFKNMNKLDASAKSYMQELESGSKYGLYKSYYADMKNATSDVAQTNLKEFDIRTDFYFIDKTSADTKLIKIKPNLKNVRDQFKSEPSAAGILDNKNFTAEQRLIAFFEMMNAK